MNYNKIKSKCLGMSYSTARQRLHQAIIFSLSTKNNENICFRCNKTIDSIEDFSIDHIENWLHKSNAKQLYFALDNIKFSHKNCNSKFSRCSHKVNAKSGYKGVEVYCDNRKKPYRAILVTKEKRFFLGSFCTAAEAARAYDEAALRELGEFAVTNKQLGLLE